MLSDSRPGFRARFVMSSNRPTVCGSLCNAQPLRTRAVVLRTSVTTANTRRRFIENPPDQRLTRRAALVHSQIIAQRAYVADRTWRGIGSKHEGDKKSAAMGLGTTVARQPN